MYLVDDIDKFRFYSSKIQNFFSDLSVILKEHRAHIRSTDYGICIMSHGRSIFQSTLSVIDNKTIPLGINMCNTKDSQRLIDEISELLNKYKVYMFVSIGEDGRGFSVYNQLNTNRIYRFSNIDICEQSILKIIDDITSMDKDFEDNH